jgi:hypothetical protein
MVFEVLILSKALSSVEIKEAYNRGVITNSNGILNRSQLKHH